MNINKVSLVALLCVLGLIYPRTSHGGRQQQQREQAVSREEYEVYSVVAVRAALDSTSRDPKRIVFLDRTFQGQINPECFTEDLRVSFADAVSDLNAKNNLEQVLYSRFKLKSRYDMVSEKELARMKVEVESPQTSHANTEAKHRVFLWEMFYKRFQGASGYMGFSRVGFSSDRKKAVVSVRFLCGDLCALATDYALEKRPNGWHVVAKGKCALIS